ncbi:hypothetical protein [Nonomuraea typhae]|uniref:hypothetical protein n=1 Tax=Nonomuraea typhae TaxID=2603600 RepID=UPI0012FBC5D7|nr:hypothetical protein [Nonomuraea typhae]
MTPSVRHPAPGAPRSPWRSPGFWWAAAFVALLVVLAVVALVLPDRASEANRPSARPTSTASPASPAAAAGSEPDGGRCPIAAPGAQALPAQPPADVTWSVFHGVAQPASRLHGPHRVEGEVARCFAHTPPGALIAAWQLCTRFVLADDWRQVVELQVVPGPGRDAYVAQRARIRADTSRTGGGYGQLAGYAIASYTPQVATIQLVSRFAATGHLQVNTVTVVWDGADWRLQLQPDGSISPSLQALSSLAGFVPWAGV